MSTTPSRCQRPPHGADNARPHPRGAPAPGPGTLRTRPTTPAARGHARTRARPQEDCSGSRTTPTEYAHKDPDLRNTHRTQGRDQALVCGPVLRNSLPCVRHQRRRTPKRNEAKGEPTVQTANLPRNRPTKPAKRPTRGERSGWPPGELRPHRPGSRARGRPAPPGEPRPHRPGTARTPSHEPLGPSSGWGPAHTAWGAAPAAPPYGSGFTARCRATTPPVRLRYWTSDQPLRAIMAPRARWSGHWRIDSTK